MNTKEWRPPEDAIALPMQLKWRRVWRCRVMSLIAPESCASDRAPASWRRAYDGSGAEEHAGLGTVQQHLPGAASQPWLGLVLSPS